MAAPTNSLGTSTRVGLREDLSDKIYDVSKADTPFISSIERESASGVLHEWQTDSLEAGDATNAQVQGNDAPITAPATTVRRGNYSQIMTEAIAVSGTLEAVSKAGRASEMAREMAKKVKKMKRSMEARATGNYAAVAPVGVGTAGQAAGALAYITTNDQRGVGGADATFAGIEAQQAHPELAAVDHDLAHLLSSWFNRGFLVLRRIDWSTPAAILEKIIRYEAVHTIRDWDDLRRRIDPLDRRCFAFFHPALNDDPEGIAVIEHVVRRELQGWI